MEAMIRDSGMELLPGYNVKWRPLPKELERQNSTALTLLKR